MSRARTLAGAIGSDGTLNVSDVAGLAAVASSGSATDLTAGTLPVARLNTTTDYTINGQTHGRGAGNVATNTAVGASALAANTTGSTATAIGFETARLNTTGDGLFVGYRAGYVNTTGYNLTAAGPQALFSNTTGFNNTAVGVQALLSNTTASNNTAVGYQAGYTNSTGGQSTYVGRKAGFTATGSYNTAIGDSAALNLTTGTANTFIGCGASNSAGADITTGSKNTIIGAYGGNQGGLDIRTASNYIVLSDGDGNPRGIFDSSGNLLVGKTSSNLTTVGVESRPDGTLGSAKAASTDATGDTLDVYSTGAGAYRFYVGMGGTIYATSTTITAISDQRLKENIQDLDVGLDAVMALKPRKFDWKEGKGKDIKGDRGWVAQEFEQVFPDMIDTWKDEPPEGEEPYKSVRADLIPVLVKAIQEQQAMINELKAEVAALKGA